MSRILVNFLIFKILYNIPNLIYLHNIPKLHPRGYEGEWVWYKVYFILMSVLIEHGVEFQLGVAIPHKFPF